MRAVIPESLVSVYDITVPYAFDVRKVRRLLDAEVEKLHPRFPDRCVADYRLRFHSDSQDMSRMHIRAVVMDRFKLAAIRKENEGCVLYAGGTHPYPVFSRDVMKKRTALAAAAFMLIAAVILLAALPRMKAGETGFGAVVSETEESDAPAFETETAYKDAGLCTESDESGVFADVPAAPDFSPFLYAVYEKAGTVSSLSWNADERTLYVQIAGLFPEQLSAMNSSSSFAQVAYQGGVPIVPVTLTLMEEAPSVFSWEETRNPDAVTDIAPVRKLIQEAGGQLVTENVSPPSLSGSVPVSAWMSFAPALSSLLESAPVRFLELSRGDADVSLSLTLSDSGAYLPLTDLACVFDDAPGLPHEPAPEDEWAAAQSEQRGIGRITRDDGTSVVFFHNADGKIERRVYEN